MKAIQRRIAAGRQLLLFLDYDGTLVPIKKLPQNAVLHPARRDLLKRLSQKAFVCIVTGRSLDDIRRLVALENIAYIGNHGLEQCWNGKLWIHPRAIGNRTALGIILAKIRERTAQFPNLLIEDKGVTASIHFRSMAPNLAPIVRRIVKNTIRRNSSAFKLADGKKVLEIRPDLNWNKGTGIQELRRRFYLRGNPLMVYIGDDRTDEDAFRVLGRSAVTIHVGRRKDTQARYQMAQVDQVWDFLRAIHRLLNLLT
jgi:trehalose-phosphatase